MQNNGDFYLGESDKEILLKKLNQIKNNTGNDVIEEYKSMATNRKLKASELIELLRKSKEPIPDICCFHCPKLRRFFMKNNKSFDFQDLTQEDEFQTTSIEVNKNSKDEYKNEVKYSMRPIYVADYSVTPKV